MQRERHTIDATGKSLGRLATEVATILCGKHKPTYARNVDDGDFVTVVNASKVKLTGKKETQKIYRHHSFYPGGLKEVPLIRKRAQKPESIVEHAVKGMLPGNKLRTGMLKRLTVKQ